MGSFLITSSGEAGGAICLSFTLASGKRGAPLLPADHQWAGVLSQAERGPSRPKAGEPPARRKQQHQDRRLRSRQLFGGRLLSRYILRISELRGTRGDLRTHVRGTGGGHLVERRDSLCAALRPSPLRRREHSLALPEDQKW